MRVLLLLLLQSMEGESKDVCIAYWLFSEYSYNRLPVDGSVLLLHTLLLKVMLRALFCKVRGMVLTHFCFKESIFISGVRLPKMMSSVALWLVFACNRTAHIFHHVDWLNRLEMSGADRLQTCPGIMYVLVEMKIM